MYPECTQLLRTVLFVVSQSNYNRFCYYGGMELSAILPRLKGKNRKSVY